MIGILLRTGKRNLKVPRRFCKGLEEELAGAGAGEGAGGANDWGDDEDEDTSVSSRTCPSSSLLLLSSTG